MSKNNNRQQNEDERAVPRELSELEEEVLHLFQQLDVADRRHVLRMMQALRDSSS